MKGISVITPNGTEFLYDDLTQEVLTGVTDGSRINLLQPRPYTENLDFTGKIGIYINVLAGSSLTGMISNLGTNTVINQSNANIINDLIVSTYKTWSSDKISKVNVKKKQTIIGFDSYGLIYEKNELGLFPLVVVGTFEGQNEISVSANTIIGSYKIGYNKLADNPDSNDLALSFRYLCNSESTFVITPTIGTWDMSPLDQISIKFIIEEI